MSSENDKTGLVKDRPITTLPETQEETVNSAIEVKTLDLPELRSTKKVLLSLFCVNFLLYLAQIPVSLNSGALAHIQILSIPIICAYYLVEGILFFVCGTYNWPITLTFRIVWLLYDLFIIVLYSLAYSQHGNEDYISDWEEYCSNNLNDSKCLDPNGYSNSSYYCSVSGIHSTEELISQSSFSSYCYNYDKFRLVHLVLSSFSVCISLSIIVVFSKLPKIGCCCQTKIEKLSEVSNFRKTELRPTRKLLLGLMILNLVLYMPVLQTLTLMKNYEFISYSWASLPLIAVYYIIEISLFFGCDRFNWKTTMFFRFIWLLHDFAYFVFYTFLVDIFEKPSYDLETVCGNEPDKYFCEPYDSFYRNRTFEEYGKENRTEYYRIQKDFLKQHNERTEQDHAVNITCMIGFLITIAVGVAIIILFSKFRNSHDQSVETYQTNSELQSEQNKSKKQLVLGFTVLNFCVNLGISTCLFYFLRFWDLQTYTVPIILIYYLAESYLLFFYQTYNWPFTVTFRIIFLIHDLAFFITQIIITLTKSWRPRYPEHYCDPFDINSCDEFDYYNDYNDISPETCKSRREEKCENAKLMNPKMFKINSAFAALFGVSFLLGIGKVSML